MKKTNQTPEKSLELRISQNGGLMQMVSMAPIIGLGVIGQGYSAALPVTKHCVFFKFLALKSGRKQDAKQGSYFVRVP